MDDPLENLIHLLQTGDDQTRLLAIEAIGRSGDERACGLLVGIALFNERGYVRYDALRALEHFPRADSISLFLKILEDPDEQVTIRCRAIKGLGYVGDVTCVDTLESLCQSDHALIADTAEIALTTLQSRY